MVGLAFVFLIAVWQCKHSCSLFYFLFASLMQVQWPVFWNIYSVDTK